MNKLDHGLIRAGLRALLTTSGIAAGGALCVWMAADGLWLSLGCFVFGLVCVFSAVYWDALLGLYGHTEPRAERFIDGCPWCFQPLELPKDQERGLHFACKLERDIKGSSSYGR